MLSRLLYLKPDELKKLLPFFGFYFLLFVMLSIGDGLSLSLFVSQVGAEAFPQYYGLTACVNIVLVSFYLLWGNRLSNLRTFQIIITLSIIGFLLPWALIRFSTLDKEIYGLFFLSREISFTLVLMHFGTFIQDYLTPDEMKRAIAFVYAGGRLGGIIGGFLLAMLVQWISLIDVALCYTALGIICLLLLGSIYRKLGTPPLASKTSDLTLSGLGELKKLLTPNSYLFWLSINIAVFIVFRWILNLQYNMSFEAYFDSDRAMAEFLGWYTAIAQFLSLVIQLFIIGRLIDKAGVVGTHLIYSILMMGTGVLNVWFNTFPVAVFNRMMETELRIALRNPVTILLTNCFEQHQRKIVRAWAIGMIIPLATMVSSLLLSQFSSAGFSSQLPWLILFWAALHGIVSIWLYQRYKGQESI